jgi:hypothetical protein
MEGRNGAMDFCGKPGSELKIILYNRKLQNQIVAARGNAFSEHRDRQMTSRDEA